MKSEIAPNCLTPGIFEARSVKCVSMLHARKRETNARYASYGGKRLREVAACGRARLQRRQPSNGQIDLAAGVCTRHCMSTGARLPSIRPANACACAAVPARNPAEFCPARAHSRTRMQWVGETRARSLLNEQIDAGAPKVLPAEISHVHDERPLVYPLSEFLPANRAPSASRGVPERNARRLSCGLGPRPARDI